jgi:hypothetical protein
MGYLSGLIGGGAGFVESECKSDTEDRQAKPKQNVNKRVKFVIESDKIGKVEQTKAIWIK